MAGLRKASIASDIVSTSLNGHPVPRRDVKVAGTPFHPPITEAERDLRNRIQGPLGADSLRPYRLLPLDRSTQLATERQVVSFRLNDGQYPKVSWLIATSKGDIKALMLNGGTTAGDLGMDGKKWNIFFMIDMVVQDNCQREAKYRGAAAHKIASALARFYKDQVQRFNYDSHPYGLGTSIQLDHLYLIGLVPIVNGKCAYACIIGFKEGHGAPKVDVPRFAPSSPSTARNRHGGNNSPAGYGAADGLVYLHDPYAPYNTANVARTAGAECLDNNVQTAYPGMYANGSSSTWTNDYITHSSWREGTSVMNEAARYHEYGIPDRHWPGNADQHGN